MSDWKDQLKEAYAAIRDQKKASKPQNKSAFDSEVNFKGRAGFNDAGIPLSPTTIKKKTRTDLHMLQELEPNTMQLAHSLEI